MQNGIGNYGYAGTADLLVPITVATGSRAGKRRDLQAEASWLVCADICIPGGSKLSLNLPVAAAARRGRSRGRRRYLPRRGSICRSRRRSRPALYSGKRDYRLLVPASALAGLRDPDRQFFPIDGSLIDAAAEPEISRRADDLEMVLKKAAEPARTAPATLDGVLALRGEDGAERAFEISANPVPAMPAETAPAVVAGAAAGLSRRRRAQRDALRLPDPVLEAAEPRQTGAWAPLRAAGAWARLYRRGARQLCRARRRAAGAARRRPGGRLGLSAAVADLCRGARLSDLCDGVEPFGSRPGSALVAGQCRRPARRPVGSGRHLLHRRAWRRSSRPPAPPRSWAPRSALR